MTLRLSDEETENLRAAAALEGRSMQEIAREAVNGHADSITKRALLQRVLDEELPRHEAVLRRLVDT